MSLQAIRWSENKLSILDQLLLPHESKYISIDDVEGGWKAINSMQVRGAPAIGIVGCLSLATELSNNEKSYSSSLNLFEGIKEKLEYLVTARPTAVNMQTASKDFSRYGAKIIKNEPLISIEKFKLKAVEWFVQLLENDIVINKKLSHFGAESILHVKGIPLKLNVLTHCNTGSLATGGYGTALGVIRKLFELNRIENVYCTETRPYNQGARLTAYELVHDNIPSTLICDDMVGALMRIKNCHAVFVGADRVTKNGDTANKIGTYQIAVLAKHHRIPFYVCAPISSIDVTLNTGDEIPIEERPSKELTSIAGVEVAAPGIACWNPAFDVTPARLITAIVTEMGTFAPKDLMDGISR